MLRLRLRLSRLVALPGPPKVFRKRNDDRSILGATSCSSRPSRRGSLTGHRRLQSRRRRLGFQCSLVTHLRERYPGHLNDLRGAIELPVMSGYVRRVQGWTPIRRQRLVELAVSTLRTIERPLMADRALDRACLGACGRGAEQRRWRSIDAPAAALDPAVPDRRRSGPTHRRRPLHERTDTRTTLRNGTFDKTISTTAGA
jgi:hypothetical protein